MNTIPFAEGVDAALDLANKLGARITDMKVADVAPGVVDLRVGMSRVVPLPIEKIRVHFEVAPPAIPPIPCQN